MSMPPSPALITQRQEDGCNFEASLIHVASYRVALLRTCPQNKAKK